MKKFKSFHSSITTAFLNNIFPNSQEFDKNALQELIMTAVNDDLNDIARVALYIQGKLDIPECAAQARLDNHVCTFQRIDMIHGTVEYTYETEDVRYFKMEEDAKNFSLNGRVSGDNAYHEDRTYCFKGTHKRFANNSTAIDTWNTYAIDGADNDIDKK